MREWDEEEKEAGLHAWEIGMREGGGGRARWIGEWDEGERRVRRWMDAGMR